MIDSRDIEVQIAGEGADPLDILFDLQEPFADDVGIEGVLDLGEIRLEAPLAHLFEKFGNEADRLFEGSIALNLFSDVKEYLIEQFSSSWISSAFP